MEFSRVRLSSRDFYKQRCSFRDKRLGWKSALSIVSKIISSQAQTALTGSQRKNCHMRIGLERELVCRWKQPANSPVSAAHYHGALGWRGQLTPLQGLFHPPLGEVKNLSRVEMPSKGCQDVSAVTVTCNMWGRLMYDDIYLIFTILIIHSNTPFIFQAPPYLTSGCQPQWAEKMILVAAGRESLSLCAW